MGVDHRYKLASSLLVALAVLLPRTAAQQPGAARQTDTDEYTRYELLAPESASFRIAYDVTATTAGARYYWNGIRRGSAVTDIAVVDLASGAPLKWELVEGKVARAAGFVQASDDGQYIQIELARPVPKDGQARLRILKTYKDEKSYFAEGDRIIFDRTLGIPRNSVVLPAGYELIGVSYPSQIRTLDDGRIAASFMNHGTAGVPYRVVGRKLERVPPPRSRVQAILAPQRPQGSAATGTGGSNPVATGARARVNFEFGERAFQDRDIVYYLLEPQTHSFRLYHDYTETREGMDRYLNVVRAGSKASDPSAFNLDTGDALKVETLTGKEARARGIRADDDAFDEASELVVIWFSPVKKGQSVRLRIWETYADPSRYVVMSGAEAPVSTPGMAAPGPPVPYEELIWDRAFGRPRNAVVLPPGWRLTANSIPAKVSLTEDERIRLDYVNDRPDNIQVFIRARRR